MDMKRPLLLRLLRRSHQAAVGFCDRCARVCDTACRSQAIREQAIDRALRTRL